MTKNLLIFLILSTVIHALYATSNKDPRMANFEQYIKTAAEIKEAHHPFLLYEQKNIPEIRAKAKSPYFKNFAADLIHHADTLLKKFPDDYHFPFTENPNYQTISETLIMAFLITDEQKYAKKAIELTKTFVNDHYLKVPIRDSGKFKDHLNNGNSVSFILNTIAVVYDSLYHEMTDDERFLVRKGIAYFCKITYEMAITKEYGLGFHKNYRAGQMGAMGLASLAIKNDTHLEVYEWLDKAKRMSIAWCNVAIKPDGVYPEGTTYLYYMLRNQLLFFEALKRESGINYFHRTNLKNALIWTLWSALPWNYEFDNFSDGGYSTFMNDIPFILQNNFPGYGDFLIYKVYGEKLRYRSNPWAILFGHTPEKVVFKNNSGFWSRLFGSNCNDHLFNPTRQLGLSKVFPEGGIAGFRSGWGSNDMLLLSYATDYEYASHSQADRGQFNLYAYGKKWAIDSGYGNDAKIANSATPSDAHNIVLIDGKGEAFDPTMRQSGTFADIVDFIADSTLGYVKIDQKPAYDFFVRYHYSNKKPYNPVLTAFRNIFFINLPETPPYALIYDDIRKDDNSHTYTWQFHTDPGNSINVQNQNVLIKPLSYSGKTILAMGSGTWDEYVSPGFNIFRTKPGNVSFKVNVPKTGKYILWALSRGTPYTWAETEVWVNGKLSDRFNIGQSRDFCWVKFSRNKKKMHYPTLLNLNQGKNIIDFKGVSSGYEAIKFLLTEDKNFIPKGLDPKHNNSVFFGIEEIIEKEDVVIRTVDCNSSAECYVKMLHPETCRITTDFYQPSRVPVHPRLLIETQAVKPNFLSFIYPHEKGMPQPIFSNQNKPGIIAYDIQWPLYTDHILINLKGEKINIKGIETDAKLLFYRMEDKNLTKLLVSEAQKLSIEGEKYNLKTQSIILNLN